MISEITLLVTALMFGGTTLYAFGFAAFVVTSLPAETAGPLIRKAFPHFYVFVFATSALAAALATIFDGVSAVILAAIALTTVLARQVLMPAINLATDAGARARFKRLHWLSVVITLGHIAAAAYVLVRLSNF
ncbi:MAG: DUF4149 domain-containing protein [Pseudomonadota bacterium]